MLCHAADVHTIQRSIVNHVEYTLACTRFSFDNHKAYRATAYRSDVVIGNVYRTMRVDTRVAYCSCSIRDRLIESWNDTNQHFDTLDVKRVYAWWFQQQRMSAVVTCVCVPVWSAFVF
jgi:glycogen phosphorylase